MFERDEVWIICNSGQRCHQTSPNLKLYFDHTPKVQWSINLTQWPKMGLELMSHKPQKFQQRFSVWLKRDSVRRKVFFSPGNNFSLPVTNFCLTLTLGAFPEQDLKRASVRFEPMVECFHHSLPREPFIRGQLLPWNLIIWRCLLTFFKADLIGCWSSLGSLAGTVVTTRVGTWVEVKLWNALLVANFQAYFKSNFQEYFRSNF